MALDLRARETATAFWLVVLLIIVLRNQILREGLGAVAKVIFRGPNGPEALPDGIKGLRDELKIRKLDFAIITL